MAQTRSSSVAQRGPDPLFQRGPDPLFHRGGDSDGRARARLPSDHFLAAAVRCRSLQWWRWRQSVHSSTHWSVHPQRFKASRWEAQLSNAHGDGLAQDPCSNTGWFGLAQDRSAWRKAEAAYLAT